MGGENSKPIAVRGASSVRSHATKSSPKQQGLMKCGFTSLCSNRSVSTVISSCISLTPALTFSRWHEASVFCEQRDGRLHHRVGQRRGDAWRAGGSSFQVPRGGLSSADASELSTPKTWHYFPVPAVQHRDLRLQRP